MAILPEFREVVQAHVNRSPHADDRHVVGEDRRNRSRAPRRRDEQDEEWQDAKHHRRRNR